jgi:PAS domain S-box-containing protein
VGVLGVVLPRETLDDVEEKPLLTELALDLARALRQMENAQAFRQLERRKEQYTRIVANAHDAMALIGPDSVYLEVNPAYEALIGRPAAEIVGHSVTEVLEASPPARSLEARVRACLAGETLRSESLQEIPRTGERFLSSVYSPCMDVDGSVSAVAVCVRDITERKRAEAELMEREERYRSLFYHDAAVKLLVDPETGQVLDANPAALEFYGRTADELCGALFDSITDRSPAQAKRHLDRVRNVTCLRFEDRHRLTGGTVRDVEVFSSRITVRGQEVLHLTVHDVTENRKLQEQMRQVQKLESVGRLAGSVAHDFNNLLMGIMGYTDLCRDELEPEHPVQEWLNEITAEAERSAALTRQLLAFARQQPVTPEVLDLNAAVGNMLKMLGRLIGENIDTRWMPADELWLVRMDPSQVDQVLANLCVNARDAIAGVGTVTIETANAMVDEAYCSDHVEAVPGPYVVLVVSDDGCGMAPEVRKRLFEPFFTTKSAGQGTGLGLATVHGIVKQNNGFINVYSEPGRGTTFRIYLPRFEGDAAVAGEDSSPVSAPDAFMGETTVLLVEDERSVRVTICLFLEEMGCRVIVADAPDLALRRVEEGGERIDLLVTDVVMPGMSGRDLAVELAGRFPAMKCLFVSGYTAVTIAQQEMLDEGAEFLSKPFTKEQLVDRVRRLLGP